MACISTLLLVGVKVVMSAVKTVLPITTMDLIIVWATHVI